MRSAQAFFAMLLLAPLLIPSSVLAAPKDQTMKVRLVGSDEKELSSFKVPSANIGGGLSLAVGDLGTDGVPEIVVGMGMGNEPRVRIYRQNGTEITSFLAYDKGFGFGVNVAVCDVDGDGKREIITVAQRGGGPHVRLFDGSGKAIGAGFMANAQSDATGLNLTCGDLDGNGAAEVITLSSPGTDQRLKAWKWNALTPGVLDLWKDQLVGDTGAQDGLVGTVSNGVLTATTMRGTPRLRRTVSFSTTGAAISAPTNVDAPLSDTFSVSVDLNGDGVVETVSAPARLWFGATKPEAAKSILVDISEQRLYAYDYGILTNTFLVSTGKKPYKTPIGEHTVLAKVPFVHYKGGSGASAYDLGIVQYNLRIIPRYYIHYAPWHNNFGYPMSHGCVNVNLSNIKWIYGWAEKDMPVSVRE